MQLCTSTSNCGDQSKHCTCQGLPNYATQTDAMPSDQDTKKPESIQLWLPSSLPTGLHKMGCVNGLVDKEYCLQLAEADDALVALHRQLCITTGVFNYKKTHVSGTGQKANTQAWTMLSKLTTKTQPIANQYHMAHKALAILNPNGDWQCWLCLLHQADIQGPTRTDDDKSEGRQELSWIWVTMNRVPIEGDEFEIAKGMPCPLHVLKNYYYPSCS